MDSGAAKPKDTFMMMTKMSYLKCMVCGVEIRPLDLGHYDPTEFEQQMWEGGTVDKLYMPYGSRFDGNVYVFAMCDDCIETKHKEGVIRLKSQG